MRVRVFGSGSGGNCLAFRTAAGNLYLVDMGFSCRELTRRMKLCGLAPDEIQGVFFTHDHSDHCSGISTFHKKFPDIPLYANGNTADAIEARQNVSGFNVFEIAEETSVGDLGFTAFSVSHDAADTVGYLFDDGVSRFFIGTDMGHVSYAVKDAFKRAHCAVLESNHDPVLLQQSDRPYKLKTRIAGKSGHLANEDAARLMLETNPLGLKALLLAHLSEECNSCSLARSTMENALKELGRSDVRLSILSQHEPSDLFEF